MRVAVRSVSGSGLEMKAIFRGNSLGDGWQWTDLQWYFGAEASALSVNANEIDINFVLLQKPVNLHDAQE